VIGDSRSSIDFAEDCVSVCPSALLRVADVFSGDEAPGMNALLRAIVRVGLNRYEGDVLDVKEGFAGLVRAARRVESGHWSLASLIDDIDTHDGLRGVDRVSQELVGLDRASVSGLLGRGCIMLGSSRCPELPNLEVRPCMLRHLQRGGSPSVADRSWPLGLRAQPGKRSPVLANGAASWACAAASSCFRTSRSRPPPNAPRRPSSSTSSRRTSVVCKSATSASGSGLFPKP
jgi:6-phosphofructokinase